MTSATLIVLVIRSQRPFFRGPPSRPLLTATLAIVAVTLLLPCTPLAGLLGFTARFLGLMALIVALYVAAAESAKHLFYRRMHP